MTLYPNQLAAHLQKNLAPVYCISGDESLLVQESCDLIRQAALQHGYDERERYMVDNSFDWQQLIDASQNLSLFSQRQLIELDMPKATTSDKAKTRDKGKTLLAYCENPPEDKILLIITPKIDAASKRTKWFKSIEKAGVFIAHWPIEAAKLPSWLQQRAKQRGLQIEMRALTTLADRVEGNLRAADQALEKLYLQFGNEPIRQEDVIESITDSSRYDVFKLIDSAMDKDPARVHKILTGLRQEGIEPILILWALAKQCRLLASLAHALAQGEQFANLCQQNGIWEKQKPLIQKALARRSAAFFQKCLQRAAKIDEIIKGMQTGNSWDALLSTFLVLAK